MLKAVEGSFVVPVPHWSQFHHVYPRIILDQCVYRVEGCVLLFKLDPESCRRERLMKVRLKLPQLVLYHLYKIFKGFITIHLIH